MQEQHLIKTSRMIALFSFILVTSIFLIIYFLEEHLGETFGYFCFVVMIVTVILNFIYLISLIGQIFISPKLADEILITCFLMLANIPISYIYILMLI